MTSTTAAPAGGTVAAVPVMPEASTPRVRHVWRFFRAGGFDQVRLDRGEDLAHLEELDQKLWVALACPVKGLEFDQKMLELIDTDKDGRIRATEVLAAVRWVCGVLKDPQELIETGAKPTRASGLPLAAINDQTAEGKEILASARQILRDLGRQDAEAITVEDTQDTARIFAQTNLNGDGVVPADAAHDDATRAVIAEMVATVGGVTDRSGKTGVTLEKVTAFFEALQAYANWGAGMAASERRPLAEQTDSAAAAVRTVKTKVDDYFARCRLAAFDPRAQAALNKQETDYLEVAAKDLSITADEVAGFPLAAIAPNRPLPLDDTVNPAWAEKVGALRDQAVRPLLGEGIQELTREQWQAVQAKLAPYEAWRASKPATPVESLGLARIQEILAEDSRAKIEELIAEDLKLKPEADAIATVDKLVRLHRDLHMLLLNFVNFREFYARRRAVFQAGTLYLDTRSCDLCVRVDDMTRHGQMAHLAQTYLAYCNCERKSTGEKITIAAAFTAGDSDNLMVGRNGVFYDRQGRDWDATIVKIVDNPISIRQAFWLPYKRLVRWIEDQIAKRAAAADAAANQKLIGATSSLEQATTPAKAAEPKKMDIGVVAALGVAVGAISTAFGLILQWITRTGPYYLPLYIALGILLISLPSMIIAALKLRQRNLGPILDANGWAVNARAKINIPFGRSLTRTAALPAGSRRDLRDPYAQSHAGRNWVIALVALAAAAWAAWYFGGIERAAPGVLPRSAWVQTHWATKPAATQAGRAGSATSAPVATMTK